MLVLITEKKAVENVKEYGDYIIISKGIALAHAGKKEAHVYKDGLSLVMCPEGIEFTEGNIVYLVFCFAVAEEKDYLKLFQEIIALGKTPKKDERYLTAEKCCFFIPFIGILNENVFL